MAYNLKQTPKMYQETCLFSLGRRGGIRESLIGLFMSFLQKVQFNTSVEQILQSSISTFLISLHQQDFSEMKSLGFNFFLNNFFYSLASDILGFTT